MIHLTFFTSEKVFQLVTKASSHSGTLDSGCSPSCISLITGKFYRSDLTAWCLCTFLLYSAKPKPKTNAKEDPSLESEVNGSVKGASDGEEDSAPSSTSSILPY